MAGAILAAISAKGGDGRTLTAKLGIPPSGIEPGFWPLAKFTALLECAAAEKHDPLFGWALGKSFHLDGLGPIATLMLTCDSGAEAFFKFTRYIPAFQNNTRYGFAISGDTARLSYLITDPTVKLRRQDALFTIAVEQSLIAARLGADVRPTRIDFQHLPEYEAGDYSSFFDCEVCFGRKENAIYLPASYLKAAGQHADRSLSAKIEAELANSLRGREQSLDFSLAIEAWMSSALSAGMNIDVEDAASDFGMSLRSFQRKLSESGINYLDLRNKVRCQIALCLLETTSTPITSIALYLGYSETSAFSRYFKNAVGMSPSQFRLACPGSGEHSLNN